MNEVRVDLGARSYTVAIEPGLLAHAGERVLDVCRTARRVVLVADRRVLECHGTPLLRSLKRCRVAVDVIPVPAGEGQKSLNRAAKIWDAMLSCGADRHTPVLAFGGGVVGDLAGFVAACWMRGVPFIQIPTTLLAQVDASVGGKVAINRPQAKNLIGAFHQPAAVLIDPDVLSTLPARDYRCGLAECVKIGVIRHADYFHFLERNVDDILSLDAFAVQETIATAVSVKAAIVALDERETRLRMLLNYGHTLGHAMESAAGYGRLRHGEAVALGMTVAGQVALARGRWSATAFRRQTALLERLGLPVRHDFDAEPLIERARSDKKNRHGEFSLVLPRGLGNGGVVPGILPAELRLAIRGWRRRSGNSGMESTAKTRSGK